MTHKPLRIVTIGGGTGSFTFLTTLKDIPHVEITAVVAMSDSGGSTGRLRVDMGVLPAGDARQALVALSRSPEQLRELFTYRYESGDMKGHTFGNLFLSTLEKITGSLEEAITQAGKLLSVKGRIYPITLTQHELVVHMNNGEKIVGEGVLDNRYITGYTRMFLTDDPLINPKVIEAIGRADIILIAPGNFYCSITPNFLVTGLTEALQKSRAKKIMVANLLTKEGHTDGFTVATFLSELEKLSGGFVPETVIYNTQMHVPPELEDLYKREGGALVELGDIEKYTAQDVTFIGGNLVAQAPKSPSSDTIRRSLLRHDADMVLKILELKG